MLLHLLAGSAGCGSSTNMDSSGPSGYDSLGAARLDIGTLATTVQLLLQSGLAPATQRVYLVGKKKYLCFCQETSNPHLPVTEFKLVNFVASAASRGLKHPTIKCYLSAIRHLQIECGEKDPRVESMPLLVLALWGTKREQAGAVKRTRLPITPVILEQLRRIWNRDSANHDHIMLWAACCVGFFGFLRSGEMTTSEVGEFDPGQHLTIRDITVDDIENPQVVSVRIKQSKTDPFRHGSSIVLSRTDLPLCPVVAALLVYLVVRGNRDGPLFLFRGQPLTRPRLVSELRKALPLSGLKPEKYAGHSFRIGAATIAAACGVPVDVIKTLRRWKNQAYQLYVRIPDTQLASISSHWQGHEFDLGCVSTGQVLKWT